MSRHGSSTARRAPAARRGDAETAVARIVAWVRAEPGRPFSLAAAAREAGLSRYQLIRAFRAATGRTPHAFVIAARIAEARALLAAGLTPAEVAAACGFFDQAHFTRAFKRAVGVTPAQFARDRAPGTEERNDPCSTPTA